MDFNKSHSQFKLNEALILSMSDGELLVFDYKTDNDRFFKLNNDFAVLLNFLDQSRTYQQIFIHLEENSERFKKNPEKDVTLDKALKVLIDNKFIFCD